MARDIRILGASIMHPERRVGERANSFIRVDLISEDLKHKPVHRVELSEDEALRLATQLLRAVGHLRGEGW